MKVTAKPFIFFFLGAVFFLLAGMYFRPLEIGDFWFHLKSGELIVEQGRLPLADSYSYTAKGVRWLDTQWLGDVIFYGLYRFFGLAGLQFFRALFFTFVLGLLFFSLYRRLLLCDTLLVILPVCFLVLGRLNCRPAFFHLLFIQLYFYLLSSHQQNPFKKTFLVIPLLQFIWQNIHIGGVYLSWLMLAVFLAGAYLDAGQPLALFFPLREVRPDTGRIFREQKNLFLLIATCLACALLNPYGVEGLLYPLRIIFASLQQDMFIAKNYIGEWQPIFRTFSATIDFPGLLYLYLAGITLATLLVRIKKIAKAYILLFAVFLFLSLSANRFRDVFAILSAAIFSQSLFVYPGMVFKQAEKLNFTLKRVLKPLALLFLLTILIFRGLEVFTSRAVVNGRLQRKYGVGIDFEHNPEAGLRFLDEHRLFGNIYNSHLLGSYILWREFPLRKVFIDARADLYSSTGVIQEMLALNRQGHWEKLVKKYDLAIAILRTDLLEGSDFNVTRYILSSREWVGVYLDGACVIFLKKDKFPAEFFKRHELSLFKKLYLGREVFQEYLKSASRYPDKPILRGVVAKIKNFPDPWEFVVKGNWLINIGSFDEAIVEYLKALAINPLLEQGDFWLGYCFYKKGRYADARVFAKRALQIAPGHPEVLTLAAELEKDRNAQQALFYYKQALRQRPEDAMLRELLADFAFAQGEDREAWEAYLWLRKRYPARLEYQLKAAVLYGKRGEFHQARQLLAEIISRDENNIDAHFNLAVVYRYLGLIELCKKELEKTISLKPDHPQAKAYLNSLLFPGSNRSVNKGLHLRGVRGG
jgi:Tfp pilus assembly protein PilF